MFADCVEDVCAVSPNALLMRTVACNALEEMALMCRDKGAYVGNWQRAAGCGKGK